MRIWPLWLALVMSKLTGANVLCMGKIYGMAMIWWRNHHIIGQLFGDFPGKEGSLGIHNWVTFMHNIYVGIHVNCQLLLSEHNQNWNMLRNFSKLNNIKSCQNPFSFRIVVCRLHSQCRQHVHLCKVANMSKIWTMIITVLSGPQDALSFLEITV